jgi:hypothetical protein
VTLALAGLAVAAAVTWPAQVGMRGLPLWDALAALVCLVAVGVAGDMVGVAAAAADEAALHAMASRRLPGSREALALKRNAPHVTSICGDIVGDVAGTASGAAAAAMAARLAAAAAVRGALPAWTAGAAEVAAVAVVAALTVGGKAFGKGIALARANEILYGIGHFAHACAWVLPGRRARAPGGRRRPGVRAGCGAAPRPRDGAGEGRGASVRRRR